MIVIGASGCRGCGRPCRPSAGCCISAGLAPGSAAVALVAGEEHDAGKSASEQQTRSSASSRSSLQYVDDIGFARGAMPPSPAISRATADHGAAEPGERGAQLGIGDVGEPLVERLAPRPRRANAAPGRPAPAGARGSDALDEDQPGHRRRPKYRLIRSISSGARCCSSSAAAGAMRSFSAPSRPSATGQAIARPLGADDRRPIGLEPHRGPRRRAWRRSARRAATPSARPRESPGRRSLSAVAPARLRPRFAALMPSIRSASPLPPPSRPTRRCCSPGTTAIAATCRGGRRPATAPIRTACGSARSCCSRRRWRPSAPILTDSWRAGPTFAALAAASLDEVLQAVAGARLLRARPQPARLRPRRRRAPRRAFSRRCRRRCARCRGSATTPRRRSRRSPSTGRWRRSTAMSSASSPGFSP